MTGLVDVIRRSAAPAAALAAAAALLVASAVVMVIDHSGNRPRTDVVSAFVSCHTGSTVTVTTAPIYAVTVTGPGHYDLSETVGLSRHGTRPCDFGSTIDPGQHPVLTVDGVRTRYRIGVNNPIPAGPAHTFDLRWKGSFGDSRIGLGRREISFDVVSQVPLVAGDSGGHPQQPLESPGAQLDITTPPGTTIEATNGNDTDLGYPLPTVFDQGRLAIFGVAPAGDDSFVYQVRYDQPTLRTMAQVAPYALTVALTILVTAALGLGAPAGRRARFIRRIGR